MKSVLNSPRLLGLKKKKYKIFRMKIFIFVILFFLILVALSFLSKWEKLNINNIQITGNKILETKEIETIAEENITGNYFGIFPKTNFLIYPQNQIETELKNKFKRIKNISVNNKNIKTLDISLTERIGLYIYCGSTPLIPDIPSEEKCYFMDEDGYIFGEAPYFSGEIYLKFYGKTENNEPSGSYFSQSNFKNLIFFKETLDKIGIKGVIFYVQDDGDVKLYLSSFTSKMGPEIIFKADSNFEKIIENLQSVLSTEPLQSDFKNKYSSLLSIDLRFGNKVYYKFK